MTIFAPLLALSLLVAPPPPPDAEDASPPSLGAIAAGPLELAELTTPRFKIVHTKRARAAAELLAKDLEWMRDDVASLLGRDWPGVTEVRLGFGKEEYEALALPGGKPPSWAIALAYPGRNVVLVEAVSLTRTDGPQTVRHELVHVGLGQFGTGWPRWFQEGLAQQLTGEAQWRMEHITTLTRAVTQDRVFDFDDLTDAFPERADDVEIAYAQSVAFIEFLRERHGTRPFVRLLERMAEGDHFDKAFGVAFLVPRSMEEEAFKKDLPRKYPWWPLLLSTGTLVWVVSSVLVVMAWARRRRVVKALRAEQLRVETLHELAKSVIGLQPANDDAVPDEFFPFEGTPMPWVVNIVVGIEPAADARKTDPRAGSTG